MIDRARSIRQKSFISLSTNEQIQMNPEMEIIIITTNLIENF